MPGGFQSFSFSGMPGQGSTGGFRASNPMDIFAQMFGGQMGADMEVDMDEGGGGGGFGGMGGMSGFPGMGRSSRSAGHQKQKSQSYERKLAVSLEDLYRGAQKKVKITRDRVVNGQVQQVAKELIIDIKPGWKAGTKITFEGESDERPGMI